MTNIIPIHDTSIPAPDIADRLDEEIEHVWGLIGCLQTISTEYSGDPPYRRRTAFGQHSH